MVAFWGWLPHLNPGLHIEFPEQFMRKYLKKWVNMTIYSTDYGVVNTKNAYNPKISIYDDFSYSKEFCIWVDYDKCDVEICRRVMTKIDKDGFISFRPIGFETNTNKQLRNLIRPLYYFFRHIFGCSLITHFDNPLEKPTRKRGHESIDDTFTITENASGTKKEAFDDVIRSLIELCERNIRPLKDEKRYKLNEKRIRNQNDILYECSFWGSNIIELEKNLISYDEYYSYKNTFELYKGVATNIISKTSLQENTIQNNRSISIGKHNLVVAIMAALVSFLAGSLFCEYVTSTMSTAVIANILFVTIFLATLLVVSIIVIVLYSIFRTKRH